MQDNQFTKNASSILEEIYSLLENHDDLEVDFLDDVLNVKSKHGHYVINRNSAAKQIWLSSPVSGPSHFNYTDNKWLNKNGANLLEILKNELKIA